MSTTVEPTAATVDHDHADAHADAHAHPSDLKYIKIALILGALTALEVATYFWEDANTKALVAMLVPLMVIKFYVVAGYFMHLKFDSPLFTRMFVAGLAFAVGVYGIMLTVFEFW
jgi:cytochrome c oxidase subunit 4